MNITLERLKKEDYNDLVNLLNNVFTIQNNTQMDFESMFPRVFVKSDETMGWHMGAKVDGKLVGVAASYPFTYRVGGYDLKISAGGNVAVDNSMRGQGIMQKMLNKLNEENQADGFDICYLHGDRFRYRNFGYERCGVEFYFTLSKKLMGNEEPTKKFKYIDFSNADDGFIKRVYEVSNNNDIGVVREEKNFMLALKTHKRIPVAVVDEDDNIEGYFVIFPNKPLVNEIFIKDVNNFCDIFKGYMQEKGIVKMDIRMPAFSNLMPQAHTYCDKYQILQPANFIICNFKRVVEAFMIEKSKHSYMPDGCITLNSEIFGSWSIEKKGDLITVLPYSGKAQIELPGYTAYPFLFGMFMPMDKVYSAEEEFIIKSWFPIPLYCPDLS